MTEVYKTVVNEIGNMAESFKEQKMIILFGDNAPDTLKDFCHCIKINPIKGEISVGNTIYLDDCEYNITAVGELVMKNLNSLGHITIVFNNAKEAELAGSLYVEDKDIVDLKIGSKIAIKK